MSSNDVDSATQIIQRCLRFFAATELALALLLRSVFAEAWLNVVSDGVFVVVAGFSTMFICRYPSGPSSCTPGLVLQNALGPDALEDAIAAAGTDGIVNR